MGMGMGMRMWALLCLGAVSLSALGVAKDAGCLLSKVDNAIDSTGAHHKLTFKVSGPKHAGQCQISLLVVDLPAKHDPCLKYGGKPNIGEVHNADDATKTVTVRCGGKHPADLSRDGHYALQLVSKTPDGKDAGTLDYQFNVEK